MSKCTSNLYLIALSFVSSDCTAMFFFNEPKHVFVCFRSGNYWLKYLCTSGQLPLNFLTRLQSAE